jgi:hypothetical protein
MVDLAYGRNPDMSRIWGYSLVADNGMAPCIERGILTLCLCKPMIRKSASVGEWVVGFVPKRINDGRVHVCWAGRIAGIFPMGDCEKQFPGRQDAIYKLTVSGWEFLRADYHEEIRDRDLNGKNALIFEPFWYWGGVGMAVADDIDELARYYVGQTAKNSSRERIARLQEWLRSVAEPGLHGEPRDELGTISPEKISGRSKPPTTTCGCKARN